MKLAVSITLVSASLAGVVCGQSPALHRACGPRADRDVISLPPLPPLPAAGEAMWDPTFCTRILRVTDDAGGQFFQTAYAYWPTFNVDSTRIYVLRDEGGLTGYTWRFDPVRFSISEKSRVFAQPSPDGDFPRTEDAIWSGVDPNVLYCHSKLNLWAYNVATHEYTLVRDFSPELAEGYLSQMSRSIDDRVFAATTQNKRHRVSGSMAWLRGEDRVVLRPDEPEGLDEVQVDKSGRYLLIKTGGHGPEAIQDRVVDLVTGAVEELTDGPPDYAPGHSDSGSGVVVGYENWRNRILRRKLAKPHGKKPVLDLADDWSQDVHISMLADDEGWALLSFYRDGVCGVERPLHNEIALVSTDGSERVLRLAHHRSCVSEYWDSPRANISRDGRFVAFTSNWGGADRRDVFILRVPAH